MFSVHTCKWSTYRLLSVLVTDLNETLNCINCNYYILLAIIPSRHLQFPVNIMPIEAEAFHIIIFITKLLQYSIIAIEVNGA